jgi:hypothetical protein
MINWVKKYPDFLYQELFISLQFHMIPETGFVFFQVIIVQFLHEDPINSALS